MTRPRPGTIFLFLWGFFLTGAVIVYLTYLQPARLGRTIADTLSASLGIGCDIQQVELTVLPHPGVILRGMKLRRGTMENVEFRADACRADLSWLSVLRFKPLVRSVELQGAVVDMTLPLRGKPPILTGRRPQAQPSRALPALPRALTGMRVTIRESALRLRGPEGTGQVVLGGLNGTAKLPGLFRGSTELTAQSATFNRPRFPTVTASELSLTLQMTRADREGDVKGTAALSAGLQMESLESALGRPVEEAYQYFPLPEPARVALTLDINARPTERLFTMAGVAQAAATLPMNGHLTPIALKVPFAMTDPDAVELDGMAVEMGNDHATVSGRLTGLARKEPVLTGQAYVGHFSLIRWFGFARSMPAGLQQALNNISGTLDFVLTPEGVDVPQLQASVLDMTLTGSGGCADFREPDVVIAGHLGKVDLNPLFPEIGGEAPARPDLPPPAIPMTNDGAPARVGYDIHLAADSTKIWKVAVNGVDCRIVPAQAPERPEGRPTVFRPSYALLNQKKNAPLPNKGTLLAITVTDACGGKAEAQVHLDDRHRVTAAVRQANAADATGQMAGFPALGGRVDADADLTFAGGSAGEVIASLAGQATATVKAGYFGSNRGARLPFQGLSLQADVAARPPKGGVRPQMPSTMDFGGQWKAELNTENWVLSTNGPAVLTFSMENGLPVAMAPQNTDFRLRLKKETLGAGKWPADLELRLKALTSFDLRQQGVATLADLSGGHADVALGGTITVNNLFASPSAEGHAFLRTEHLRRAAGLVGVSLPETRQTSAFRSLNLAGNFTWSRPADTVHALQINHLHGKLDDTTLNGSVNATLGARPLWTARLAVDTLDLDAYRSATTGGPKTKPSPVPLDFLLNTNLDLSLSAKKIRAYVTPLSNLQTTLTLKQGTLQTGVFTAAFPGEGSLTGSLHGEARRGKQGADSRADPGQLNLRTQLQLTGVDMLPLTRARGQETLMAGTGNGQFDLQAVLRDWNDIPGKLDGNWSIYIRDGYLISAGTDAAATSGRANSRGGLSGGQRQMTSDTGRTPFQTLSASGNVLAGVVRSNNFSLRSPVLSVTGGGELNLTQRTIQAKATATVLGVPEIPIEITGSLDNPQTSYQLMDAVAGTIGNIGSSVLGVVGNVLTAPFRLFGKKTITQP